MADNLPICFLGSHTSALPLDVLKYAFVDFALLNEGVHALHKLLATGLRSHLGMVLCIAHQEIDAGGQVKLVLLVNKF